MIVIEGKVNIKGEDILIIVEGEDSSVADLYNAILYILVKGE